MKINKNQDEQHKSGSDKNKDPKHSNKKPVKK